MILLSDANVLIDMGHVSGLSVLVSIAPIEVLDVVLQECEHDLQPELVEAIRSAGITEVSSNYELLNEASQYIKTNSRLSIQDSMCLHHAKRHGRVLLTNERPLRTVCDDYAVEVHGTIWIIETAHERRLHTKSELCHWLTILSSANRRLPSVELQRLKHSFGCS